MHKTKFETIIIHLQYIMNNPLFIVKISFFRSYLSALVMEKEDNKWNILPPHYEIGIKLFYQELFKK